MANINDILNEARIKGCSDVHIGENTGITLRQDGKLIEFEQTFSNEEIKEMILSMCKDRILKIVEKHEDADFVYVNDLGRHRVNIYFQQGYMTAAIRIINEQIKTLEELNLPDVLHKLALLPRGLVLVTGPTGSGKSTTLAAMIDFISSMRNCHILTIEDPIEYAVGYALASDFPGSTMRELFSFADKNMYINKNKLLFIKGKSMKTLILLIQL